MKKFYVFVFAMVSLATVSTFYSCSDDEDTEEELDFVGQPGNPRFNLQFSNEDNVDLDLYVQTPNGTTVYYGNSYADGGELDVDCMCGSCTQGGNENIFWEDGTAPEGTYTYWVEYYDYCTTSASSSFTVRVIKNNSVVATHTGTLSSGESTHWTHTQTN